MGLIADCTYCVCTRSSLHFRLEQLAAAKRQVLKGYRTKKELPTFDALLVVFVVVVVAAMNLISAQLGNA